MGNGLEHRCALWPLYAGLGAVAIPDRVPKRFTCAGRPISPHREATLSTRLARLPVSTSPGAQPVPYGSIPAWRDNQALINNENRTTPKLTTRVRFPSPAPQSNGQTFSLF